MIKIAAPTGEGVHVDARWMALAVLTAARVSMGLQFQSVASVAPPLVQDLGLEYADLGTLIGLYFLPGVVMAMPAGLLGRRIGDTRVVVTGLLLMALGGAQTGLAADFSGLAAGRLISGIGAVLLNVVMSKMVTDWFAGRREIVVAMAIFVSSMPIGMGFAVLSLGPLAEATGWSTSLMVSAGMTLLALLLVVLVYRPHPYDRPLAMNAKAPGPRISSAELGLVCVAGAIWGLFNGAMSVMFGFAPTFLSSDGLTATSIGLVVGMATWLVVASVQAGGIIAQKWGRPGLLLALSAITWTASLVAMAQGHGGSGLVVAGALMGLPVGIIMSLPAQALRPENRALGMGLFYVWLYAGQGAMPPAAGWLQDITGSTAAPLYLAAAAVFAMLPLYVAFRAGLAVRVTRLA